jgi:hypothetical protein
MAMIAITTSNSISVKPRHFLKNRAVGMGRHLQKGQGKTNKECKCKDPIGGIQLPKLRCFFGVSNWKDWLKNIVRREELAVKVENENFLILDEYFFINRSSCE